MTVSGDPLQVRDDDFVEHHYREILGIAKRLNRNSVAYDAIPWGKSYLLWRHDIDFSINRSFRLAQINLDYSVHSTFFVNIHSTFYNPFERSQASLLRRIAEMGHDFGVHFDGAFYDDNGNKDYEEFISREAALLSELVHKTPVAVSFHNPTEAMLQMDQPFLGGLVNAYSKKLMSDADYCSDSNGYWRFRRLADVVADKDISRLQVLTHPGWWLEQPMAPRKRIERAAFGRAGAIMDDYDKLLREFGRRNITDQGS